MFYNTSINTYIWIISNRKLSERKGKVQLINATSDKFFSKMKKSLGNKRHEVDEGSKITSLYGDFKESEGCKILDNDDLCYSQVTVERPLVKDGKIVKDKNGNPKPNPSLRDTEIIPFKQDIYQYIKKEVKPHVPDAWVDESKTRKGFEINFTKYFYEHKSLRSLEEIKKDILALEEETQDIIEKVIE